MVGQNLGELYFLLFLARIHLPPPPCAGNFGFLSSKVRDPKKSGDLLFFLLVHQHAFRILAETHNTHTNPQKHTHTKQSIDDT